MLGIHQSTIGLFAIFINIGSLFEMNIGIILNLVNFIKNKR